MELSRKTKPLGPRQRLAYIKPFKAAVDEAKAKLAADQAAHDKAAKAREALRFTALFRKAQGIDTTLGTTFDVSVYGLSVKTPKERRLARQALIDGTHKVTVNGGSPGVPALTKRMRLMAKADIRRLRGIDKRLANLREQREALIVASFERGKELTATQIADHLLKRAAVNGPAYIDTYAVSRAQSALAEAEKHDGTRTCPCSTCAYRRQDAERQKRYAAENKAREKAEAKRLAKLGTRDLTCPECKEFNAKVQVEQEYGDDDDARFVECPSCEVATYLVDLIEADKIIAPSPGQEALAFPDGITERGYRHSWQDAVR